MNTASAMLVTGVALWLGSAAPAVAQDVRAGVEQLAAQIAKGAPEGKQLRVAVADFPDLQGATSDFGRFVASRLTTRLAQDRRFFVIERQRLGQVLAELKFSMSDLVDPTKAKQLGRMVGVEGIVVGTVSDLGNQVDIDARLIEIETNRMLLGASVTISKDPIVTELLQRGRQEAPAAPPGPGAPPAVGAAPPPPAPGKPVRVEAEDFVFEPRGCRRTAGKLDCSVAFVNTGSVRELAVNARHGEPRSQLIDNKGNQYPPRIGIGERWDEDRGYFGFPLKETFVPEVPVIVHFVTEDVSADATHMTVVVGINGFKATPVVRNIPIIK